MLALTLWEYIESGDYKDDTSLLEWYLDFEDEWKFRNQLQPITIIPKKKFSLR